ncbi:MAG: nicotinate phosphoribosyltransferase, partial [Anaerolineales bacterium]|nr:nicotinate phosphoribosyltransferase [Anaerolineales bacterium]
MNSIPISEGILFTDQYQLTMAQLYYELGLHDSQVQFDHYFRSYPDYGAHKAGYCINAGLEWLVDWMSDARISPADLEKLKSQTTRTGEPFFSEGFLRWLERNGNYDAISLQAIPEGRVVHPNVPLTVVRGPLAMAQILETPLLNHLNYQTLIATKAARIRVSGHGRLLLEFGLRRGPGRGANAGTRAALIGGADFSSNVGISHALGYQPSGTHAHSMVQLFMAMGGTELDAFRAFAELYPDDCLLLVDTINTLDSGVPNAIRVFEELRRKGHEPVGVRLDSGDLAYFSIQISKMFDEAGFEDAVIVLSNNLDELVIWQIITQIQEEAPRYGVDPDRLVRRLVYGVGTRLITSHGQPHLGGVYKLVAVCKNDHWVPMIKISDSASKTPNPGHKLAWRIYDERGKASADLVCLEGETPGNAETLILHHPQDPSRVRSLSRTEISEIELLHETIIQEGRLEYSFPSIAEIRNTRDQDLSRLDPGVLRIINPHIYHVSLSEELWNLKQELISGISTAAGL